MVTDAVGATAPASSALPASITSDTRKGALTKADADGGSGFDSQFKTALAGDAERAAEGTERARPAAAKGKHAKGADENAAGVEDEQDQPAAAFVLTPWLPIGQSSEVVVPHAKGLAKKTDDSTGDAGAAPAGGAPGVQSLATPAGLVPPITASVPVTPPPVDLPVSIAPVTVDGQQKAASDTPGRPTQFVDPVPVTPPPLSAAGDGAGHAKGDDGVVAPGDSSAAKVPVSPEPSPAPGATLADAQPVTSNASYHRNGIADLRAGKPEPGESKPEVRSVVRIVSPATRADGAPRVQAVSGAQETPADVAGKPSAKGNGAGAAVADKTRTPADRSVTTDVTQTSAPPFAAAPEPPVSDPAPAAPSPQSAAHIGTPIVAAPTNLMADPAAWTPSEVVGPSSHDVPDADTPDRLVQSLRMQFLRGGGDAVVQLRPEHLGPVTVSLKVEQGGVSARIVAADPVVAEWLHAHQDTLRDGLQSNGLALDRLVIDRDGRSPERRERRETPARQRFRTPAEPQSTFELTI